MNEKVVSILDESIESLDRFCAKNGTQINICHGRLASITKEQW